MASQSLKLFESYMEAQNLKVQVLEDHEDVCRVGFNLKNTSLAIFVAFDSDDNNVHFEGLDFVKIPDDKKELAYKLCNICNDQFRWAKFVWDESQEQLVCRCDAVIQLDSAAEECFEIVMRMASIVDEAYTIIMKALWS